MFTLVLVGEVSFYCAPDASFSAPLAVPLPRAASGKTPFAVKYQKRAVLFTVNLPV